MDNQHIALTDETGRDILDPDNSSSIGVCLAITWHRITDCPIERRRVLYLPRVDWLLSQHRFEDHSFCWRFEHFD